MKIIERAIMPDGTKIQINDWSEDFSCYAPNSEIAAYPLNRYGENVRVRRHFDSEEETISAFQQLITGEKSLVDLSFTTMKAGRDIPWHPGMDTKWWLHM